MDPEILTFSGSHKLGRFSFFQKVRDKARVAIADSFLHREHQGLVQIETREKSNKLEDVHKHAVISVTHFVVFCFVSLFVADSGRASVTEPSVRFHLCKIPDLQQLPQLNKNTT